MPDATNGLVRLAQEQAARHASLSLQELELTSAPSAIQAMNSSEASAEHGLARQVMIISVRAAKNRRAEQEIISALHAIQAIFTLWEAPVKHGLVLLVQRASARHAWLNSCELEAINAQRATMAMNT